MSTPFAMPIELQHAVFKFNVELEGTIDVVEALKNRGLPVTDQNIEVDYKLIHEENEGFEIMLEGTMVTFKREYADNNDPLLITVNFDHGVFIGEKSE